MIKTMIIDDERLARKELINALKPFQELEIVGESGNPVEAIDLIHNQKPDLVFLDIQMPGKSGFEVLEELVYVPEVIFVTAYDEYAIKAFEVNALDYLLKPVDEARLAESVKKVSAEIAKKKTPAVNEGELLGENDQVFVKDGDKCWFVQLSDIRLFESEGNYVKVHFGEHKPMILKSLNNLDKRLDPRMFFRANRKYMLNLKWIDKVESWFNGGLMAKLKTGEEVEISRRQAAKLKEQMSL